jgi:hypothetical protein
MRTRRLRKLACAFALTSFALVAQQSTAAEPAAPQSAFFLTQLVLDAEKGVDADVLPPQLGYLSASIGAFTLDGRVGHATFRWNHHLEVDWHDHDLKYVGEERDVQGNKFWVYAASINHDGHDDEIKLFFAQRQIQSDEGYRIFFSHGADPHDTHLLCIDANRLPYHKRP